MATTVRAAIARQAKSVQMGSAYLRIAMSSARNGAGADKRASATAGARLVANATTVFVSHCQRTATASPVGRTDVADHAESARSNPGLSAMRRPDSAKLTATRSALTMSAGATMTAGVTSPIVPSITIARTVNANAHLSAESLETLT